jgi:hypothetical protein
MGLWMMYVIPVEGRENEINHMNDVKDRFTDYKITLDSLWINSNNPSVASMAGVTVSTSIDLGAGGGNTQAGGMFLPMMKPVGSSAVLSLEDSGDWLNISAYDSSLTLFPYNYSISKMQYQSQNHYWIQQKYYYQTGGVFLEQANGSTVRVTPPISIINSSASATSRADFTTSVNLAPITLDGGASIGGTGPVRVDTRLKTVQGTLGPIKMSRVNISVSVPDYTTAQMWNATFLDVLSNGGVTNASWYKTGTSSPGVSPGKAYVLIKGPYNSTADTNEDVWFTMRPAEYAVTFNNIAYGIT